MEFEKIKIELNEKELELITELNDVKNKISDLDAKSLNNDLMESIKSKSIETITIALGVSDILEKTAHSNGLMADKEYKRYQKWEETPSENRSKDYKPKFLHKNEFSAIIETASNTPKYSKEIRDTYLGKEFANRKNELYSEGKPFSSIDGYTGNKIYRFNDDIAKNSHVEHINPVYQVQKDPIMQKYFTQDERKEIVNSKENTCLTRGDINISKGKRNTTEAKVWAEENKERFDLNPDLIKEKLDKSNEKFDKEKLGKKIKYKAKEQLEIAGSNALKSGAKAAVGQLLTITISETINEFKKEDDESSFSVKAKNIKNNVLSKASDILETFKEFSLNAFISTLLDALLNSLLKVFKNIIKFIKTAFYSIIKAFKVLVSKEYSKEEKLVECRKILGVTVAGLIGLALEELIEKALLTYLPFTAPFAGYVSPVLAGLIVGVGSVMIMNYWDRYKDSIELTKLNKKENLLLEKSSKISLLKTQISDVEASESVKVTFSIFQNTLPLISSFKENIEASLVKIREVKDDVEKQLDVNKDVNKDNNNLLNLLESL